MPPKRESRWKIFFRNKNVPDYIKTYWQSKCMAEMKISDSDCVNCQDTLIDQMGYEDLQNQHENKCPDHSRNIQLYFSNFDIYELKLKNYLKYDEVVMLDVEKPEAVANSIWREWAEFWNDHKETYLSLSWIHRFPEYCQNESIIWKEKIFKDYPYLKEEISYYDDVTLRFEEDFLKISVDEVQNHPLTLEVWKELCLKRFWIQFRLYLRNEKFEEDVKLKYFFNTKGIDKEPPPFKSIGERPMPKYVKQYMPQSISDGSVNPVPQFDDDDLKILVTAGFQFSKEENTILKSFENETNCMPIILEGNEEIVDEGSPRQCNQNATSIYSGEAFKADLDELERKFNIEMEELNASLKDTDTESKSQESDCSKNLITSTYNSPEESNFNGDNDEDNSSIYSTTEIASSKCVRMFGNSKKKNRCDVTIERRQITTVSVGKWFGIRDMIPSGYNSILNILFTIFRPRSVFGFRSYKSIAPIWSIFHKLQRKFKTMNAMQKAERQSLLALRDMFYPDFNQMFSYPPILLDESEHITEVKGVDVNGMKILPRLIKISPFSEKERAKNKIFVKILSEEELEKEAERLGVLELKEDVIEEDSYKDSAYGSNSVIPFPEPDNIPNQDTNESVMIRSISSLCEIMKYPKSDELDFSFDGFSDEFFESWIKRHRIFHKYDEGVDNDNEWWLSKITKAMIPEVLAIHQAERLRNKTVIDAFCGVGCNTMQLAFYCDYVIAIDKSPQKLKIARNIARIYEVENKIKFMEGDFFKLSPTLEADAVFLKPPCGSGRKDDHFNVLTLGGRMDCEYLLDVARGISHNIALYLPSYSNLFQIIGLAKKFGEVEIEVSSIDEKKCGITVYLGEPIKKARELST